MKLIPAKALILALVAAPALARLGSVLEQTEEQGQRRLCGENKNGCIPFVNNCCDGSSCHMDGRCYEYPRNTNSPCIPGLSQCIGGDTCDVKGMKCRTKGTAVNDPCNFSRECEGSILGKKLTCDLYTNRCRLPGKEGDVCHGSRPCEGNLVCNNNPGNSFCQRPAFEGQSCSMGQRCASGLMCDLQGSVCRGKSDLGGRCHLTRLCKSNLYCDLEIEECRNAADVGEACSIYVPCKSNNLVCNDNDVCERKPSKCPLEGGEECGDDADDGGDGGDSDDENDDSEDDNDTDGDDSDDEDGVRCNMATEECNHPNPTSSTSPSSAPSVATPGPTVTPTTTAPTTLAPTPPPTTLSPTYETPPPTQGTEARCPLTGCIVKKPVDEDTNGDKVSVLQSEQGETRGGSGALQHHSGQRRLVLEESKKNQDGLLSS